MITSMKTTFNKVEEGNYFWLMLEKNKKEVVKTVKEIVRKLKYKLKKRTIAIESKQIQKVHVQSTIIIQKGIWFLVCINDFRLILNKYLKCYCLNKPKYQVIW